MKKLFNEKLLLYFSIILAAIIILLVAFGFKVEDMKISNAQPYILDDGWSVTFEDGSRHQVLLPQKISASAGETILLSHVLTPDMAGQTIAFHSSNQCVKVSCNTDLLYSFAQSDHRLFGHSPGSLWHFVTIPSITENTMLQIEMKSEYPNMGSDIREVMLGARSSCILSLIKQEWFGLFSGFSLLLFGILFIVLYFALGHMKMKNTGLFYLGLSSLFASVGMILSTGLLQIFYGNILACCMTYYISIFLSFIPLVLYLSETFFDAFHKQMLFLMHLYSFLFVISTILQVTNILDYAYSVTILLFINVFVMAYLSYLIYRLIRQKQNTTMHLVIVLLFMIQAICMSVDYFGKNYGRVTYSQYLFMIMLLILGLSKISEFVSLYRIEVDEEIKDNLLSIENLKHDYDILRNDSSVLIKEKEHAEKQNQDKNIFLSSISRNLMTPLTSIVGMCELLSREIENDSSTEKISTIQTAGNNAITIINNITDYCNFETNNMELKLVSYHIESMLYDMSEIVSVGILDKSIDFIVDFSPSIPRELYGDEIRIRQILTKLLSNAVKYTTEGVIRFRAEASLSEADEILLKFVISDTGTGMKEELVDTIFETFRENDESDEDKERGFGLAICKRLLDMMNATIEIESTFGDGTIFTLEIPQKIISGMPLVDIDTEKEWNVLIFETSQLQRMILKKTCMDLSVDADFVTTQEEFREKLATGNYKTLLICQEEYEHFSSILDEQYESIRKVVLADLANSIVTYENADILQRPIQCLKVYDAISGSNIMKPIIADESHDFISPESSVLIIDDNPANLKIMIGLLEPYKIKYTTTLSGVEGLELLKESNEYDLIFVDYNMPDMDGVAVLQNIRNHPESYYKNIPVVVLISHKVNGAKEIFLQDGFNHYLAKPIEILKLEKILLEYLPEEKLIHNRTTES